jgi:hypothetical protein
MTAAVGSLAGTVTMLRVIDWNRDGWDDILAAHSGGVTVFLSRSPDAGYDSITGWWTPLVLFAGGSCSDAIAVDIDHDGRMDVAAYHTSQAKLKLITHGPDVQVTVADRAMTPNQEHRAVSSESFYVLKLDARSRGNESFYRSSDETGGFSDDVVASLNRIRIRFVAAVQAGGQWVPGSALTQEQVAASVERVLVVEESTNQNNPTLDAADRIIAEFPVSTNLGYLTLDFASSNSPWDDLAPSRSPVTYHIALKMKPALSALPAPRFFVRHAATDPAQSTRAITPIYWPVNSPVYTATAPTNGQLVRVTSAVETWRHGWFGTYLPTGQAANNADGDHDDMPNVTEYILGTNPTVADYFPFFQIGSTPTSLWLQLDLPDQAREDGKVTVMDSGTMSGWNAYAQRVGTGAWSGASFATFDIGGGYNRTYFPLVNQGSRFYRVEFSIVE